MDENLCCEEEPIAIVDQQVKNLCSKEVASVKVICWNYAIEEATWEPDDVMHSEYLHLFDIQVNILEFGGQIS